MSLLARTYCGAGTVNPPRTMNASDTNVTVGHCAAACWSGGRVVVVVDVPVVPTAGSVVALVLVVAAVVLVVEPVPEPEAVPELEAVVELEAVLELDAVLEPDGEAVTTCGHSPGEDWNAVPTLPTIVTVSP